MKPVETQNKISRMMVSLAWIAFLAMLAIGFERYLNKQENPNDKPAVEYLSDGSAQVVLKQNRQGHYVANGKINGIWTTFVLDTGATNISIPADIAFPMGLKEGSPQKTRTANGVVTVYKTTLDTVTLGAIGLKNIPAHINPHMKGQEVLLGMSFLRHVEMSQTGTELTLRLRGKTTAL